MSISSLWLKTGFKALVKYQILAVKNVLKYVLSFCPCVTMLYTSLMILVCFSINDRRNQVVERRDRVKDKSNSRHNQLVDSNAYQIFNRDADEVSGLCFYHCVSITIAALHLYMF